MFRSLYSHLLYWLALRFKVSHPIMSGYRTVKLTKFELWMDGVSSSLMAKSNLIVSARRDLEMAQFKQENTMRILLNGVSYNPGRKDPKSTEL